MNLLEDAKTFANFFQTLLDGRNIVSRANRLARETSQLIETDSGTAITLKVEIPYRIPWIMLSSRILFRVSSIFRKLVICSGS